MLSKFYTIIIESLKAKVLFFSILLAFFAVLVVGLFQLNIDQDITVSLPKGDEFKELNSFLSSSKLNNQIAFSLETNRLDVTDLELLAETITAKINASSNSILKEIKYYNNFDEGDFYTYFYENLPLYLSEGKMDSIRKKLTNSNIKNTLEADFKKLISPEGSFVKSFILKDPFSLTPLALNTVKSSASSNYVVEDGITYSKDKSFIYFFSELEKGVNNNNVLQTTLANNLNVLKLDWNQNNPNNKIDYFSPFLIAVANSNQIKADTKLTLGIFISFALLLLFFYYRKISTPFYFMLPAVFGIVFSLGIIGWFKGSVSGISIASGAIVLGIILDYAFHFFTHYKHSNSLKETLDDISFPLITGSFTTIVAFLALLFTNSVILQDFGLFAAFSLLGAAIFTLLILPVIVKLTGFKFEETKASSFNFKLPFNIHNNYVFLGILVFTAFFFYEAKDIQFDSDLENLGYHPQELKDSEKAIFDLNPENEKKIFLFSKGNTTEEAELNNYNLYQKLNANDKIKKITSTAQFVIPKSIQAKRIDRWNKYWTENKNTIFKELDQNAAEIGFSNSAFDDFKKWINTSIEVREISNEKILKDIGITKLIDKSGKESIYIATIVVEKEDKAAILASLENMEGVDVLDRSSMVSNMLEVVKEDFNYILLISTVIVFLTLLIVYGRVELALIVFIPMLVSWIWILGIANILDIKFNFVNIIITTFIFGLGDDFSIFISDGILNKYKYGKDLLKTYKTGIVLSAITTIVGTGVLMFAKHPAVNSIGLISVLGMLCILLISFVLQPILYNWLIFNRIEKGRSPWTIFSWLKSAFAYLYFFFGCMLAAIIATVILLIPIGKNNKRKVMGTVLHYFGASLLYVMFNVTKRFQNKQNLDLSKPSILIANHSSVLDIIITLTISSKVVLVTNKWVYNSPFFGYLVRTAGFVLNTDIEKDIDSIKEKMADGYSIMIFPEGTRSYFGEMGRFKKGAFYLAEMLEADITPVLIHGAHYTMAKSDFQLKDSWLNVNYLPRIKFDDKIFGIGYRERSKKITKYFKEQHGIYSEQMGDTKFFKEPVIYNYLYKGPVLEWYLKVKWNLEEKNYAYYDSLIAERKNILDLGCGYGFLDYYLLFRNKERTIQGMDYDEDKITVAQNNFDKTDNLNFVQGDLRELKIESKQDVILVMDVLHYFNAKDQRTVLVECINNLNADGIIFIRDGIKDLGQRHENTKVTEFISSNVGFNKVSEEFCFFEKKFIEDIALEFNLTVEMQEHSVKTSNVLFILRS
ncbi:MAG: 1-acyl-sn-glycerol-3-phosphate acyltransferase [Planctomycetota bacterium]|jgi:1-acyl-sn-glycerol-3-phosphate acyltransferase